MRIIFLPQIYYKWSVYPLKNEAKIKKASDKSKAFKIGVAKTTFF